MNARFLWAGRGVAPLIALVLVGVMAGCALGSDEPPKFSHVCPPPTHRDDGWESGTLDDYEFDRAFIDSLEADSAIETIMQTA